MSEKERQKKNHHRKEKERQAMRESHDPREEQASVRFGEQKRAPHPERRGGERIDMTRPEIE